MLALETDELTDILIEVAPGKTVRLKFKSRVRVGLQAPREFRIRRIPSHAKETPLATNQAHA